MDLTRLAKSPFPAYPVSAMTWNDSFLDLFDRCVKELRSGNSDFESYYSPADRVFLAEIGYKSREFFDFVEDFVGEGEPTPTTALLIAAARRDYLHTHPETAELKALLHRENIPTFGDELLGMPYLPRILAKARAKLRGELDPDLMFGCGGDRRFLRTHGDIHPADFLRRVWAAKDDDAKVAEWVASRKG